MQMIAEAFSLRHENGAAKERSREAEEFNEWE